MNMHALKVLSVSLLAAAFALPAGPAFAQHEGHTMPMPAPKPASKPAVKKPPVKKPAVKSAARPAAKPKPKPAAVDHAAMGHGAPAPKPPAKKVKRPAATPAASSPPAARKAPAKAGPAAVDHAAMGHGTPATATPAAVDHAAMGHGTPAGESVDHSGMDHGAMSPAEHAAMGHGASADLPADAAPRTPIPVLTDADRAAAFPPALHGHTAHDQRIHSFWLADRLEWQDGDEPSLGWEGVAWIGGDINRLWLRSEGEASEGEIEHGDLEVLYGRSVTAWWDVVAGVRQDFGHGPSRTWAALGVQGLAPYKFEVEATAYVGTGGRTAATLEAEYETLITNRLILQWQAEASLHGRDDPAVGVASGLSTMEAGARLRYEFSRRFAPYVGVQVERAFGGTADLRRADGDPTRDTRLVAGIRFWF